MNKKCYVNPRVNIIKLECMVITTSGLGDNLGGIDPNWFNGGLVQ